MVSLEKWMTLTPLQKLAKNGEDWGKLIVANGFKNCPIWSHWWAHKMFFIEKDKIILFLCHGENQDPMVSNQANFLLIIQS